MYRILSNQRGRERRSSSSRPRSGRVGRVERHGSSTTTTSRRASFRMSSNGTRRRRRRPGPDYQDGFRSSGTSSNDEGHISGSPEDSYDSDDSRGKSPSRVPEQDANGRKSDSWSRDEKRSPVGGNQLRTGQTLTLRQGEAPADNYTDKHISTGISSGNSSGREDGGGSSQYTDDDQFPSSDLNGGDGIDDGLGTASQQKSGGNHQDVVRSRNKIDGSMHVPNKGSSHPNVHLTRDDHLRQNQQLAFLPEGWVEIEVLRAIGLTKKKRRTGSTFGGSSSRHNMYRVQVAALWAKNSGGETLETSYANLQRSSTSGGKAMHCCVWTGSHNNRLKFYFPGGNKLNSAKIVDLVGFEMVILRGQVQSQVRGSGSRDGGGSSSGMGGSIKSDEVVQTLRVTDQVQELMRRPDLDESSQKSITMLFWHKDKSGQTVPGPPGKLVCGVKFLAKNKGVPQFVSEGKLRESLDGPVMKLAEGTPFMLPNDVYKTRAESKSGANGMKNAHQADQKRLLPAMAPDSSEMSGNLIAMGLSLEDSFGMSDVTAMRSRRAASHHEAPPPKIPPRPGEEEQKRKELAKVHERIIEFCSTALDYIRKLEGMVDTELSNSSADQDESETKNGALSGGIEDLNREGKVSNSTSADNGPSMETSENLNTSVLQLCEKDIKDIWKGENLRKLDDEITEMEVQLLVAKSQAEESVGHSYSTVWRAKSVGAFLASSDKTANNRDRLTSKSGEMSAIASARENLRAEMGAAADNIKGQALTSSHAIYDAYFESSKKKKRSPSGLGLPWYIVAVAFVFCLVIAERFLIAAWGLIAVAQPRISELLMNGKEAASGVTTQSQQPDIPGGVFVE